jgi:hypothetical protein
LRGLFPDIISFYILTGEYRMRPLGSACAVVIALAVTSIFGTPKNSIADETRAFEDVICQDNRMEPWRVCVGKSFLVAQDIFQRSGIAFGTTRFRMNATNIGKLRQRMESWASGRYKVPFASARSLRRADPASCREFDPSNWKVLSQACTYAFPGFFDFDQWLGDVARDSFDSGVYAATLDIFDRHARGICTSNLIQWFDGNMLSLPLPPPRGQYPDYEADVAVANEEVQRLIASHRSHRDQILFTMTVKSYGCDQYLQ